MYSYNVEKINLNKESQINEVKSFLSEFQLELDDNVDYTVVIRIEGEIKATCSKAKSVFKCFAVSKELQGEGISNKLITALNDRLFEEGMYHSFIFTKPENISIFEGLNYKLVYQVEKAALLENGLYDINKYLNKIKKKHNLQENKNRAALVMNCNPFTLGHRYLIEEASKNAEEVIVFIVEENKSLFPFDIRYELVKEGVKDLENVKVIPGGEYIISQATFPSYFLRKKDDILSAYTEMDAGIFAEHFCKEFNIYKRFVGEEPYCQVTNQYNESLKKKLNEYKIELCIIERKAHNDTAISASEVRNLIKEDNLKKVKEIVPEVTWTFLNSLKGKEIVEKIKISDSPH